MTQKQVNWHDIFQGMLEDQGNLQELCGKIISGKAREYQQQIKVDFVVHTEGNVTEKLKPIPRPFDHFRKKNLVEYKSTWEVLNEKMFRRYVGRALDAETTEDIDYRNETTLTILTSHKPELLLAQERYKIEPVNAWKYRSSWIEELDIYIIVQKEMRGIQEGEALALLQVLESDRGKQKSTWQKIFEQDLDNKHVLRSIAEKISNEVLMSLVEEIKYEKTLEIALRMIQEGMDISIIAKLSGLTVEEIQKLKNKNV